MVWGCAGAGRAFGAALYKPAERLPGGRQALARRPSGLVPGSVVNWVNFVGRLPKPPASVGILALLGCPAVQPG